MAAPATRYLDTSFVAPYYLLEPSSPGVEAAITGSAAGSLALSEWTIVEFASLLARKRRMGELGAGLLARVKSRFDEDADTRFDVLTPQSADYSLASRLLLQDPGLGLRGPDGLHLAIAANRRMELYSLDRKLIGAATAFGIPATDADIPQGEA